MNLPKIVNEYWLTRQFFFRPDPLGFCIIQMDMFRTQKYCSMSVIERQIEKGYMHNKK